MLRQVPLPRGGLFGKTFNFHLFRAKRIPCLVLVDEKKYIYILVAAEIPHRITAPKNEERKAGQLQ